MILKKIRSKSPNDKAIMPSTLPNTDNSKSKASGTIISFRGSALK
jgi:hypothetical protein